MIRLTILVCFPREDEQVPVDWERETRELDTPTGCGRGVLGTELPGRGQL